MVSSMPRKRLRRSSSCLWIDCVPQMNRTLARPYPQSRKACCGCFDDGGMIGQAEIVIRAEIEDRCSLRDRDLRLLRAGEDALALVQTGFFDFGSAFPEDDAASLRTLRACSLWWK